MKFKELKTKEEKELEAMIEKAKDDLEAMRFKISAGQLKNVREVRKAKRLIARILTLKNEKKAGKIN
jgi:ribosomal protein L29